MRCLVLSWFAGIWLSLIGLPAFGGTFSCTFDSGLPPYTAVFGSAKIDGGGANDGGVLKLTDARPAQMGSFVIQPLDGARPVASFVATFKAYIGGGTSADGMAFLFSPNLPDAAFADLSTTGLSVVFDTYKNSPADIAPGIRVRCNKSTKCETTLPDLRSDHFIDVMIKLDPDGTLDLTYDNELIFTNVATKLSNPANARFAFGARTGSRTDNHWVDEVRIVTQTTALPYVDVFNPTGNDAAPVPMVQVTINNSKGKLKSGSVKMKFDGKPVVAETTTSDNGKTVVDYEPATLLEPGSLHRVSVQFTDSGKPAKTQEFSYAFRVTSQVYISK